MKKVTFLLIASLTAPGVFAQTDGKFEGKMAQKAKNALNAQAEITELPVQAPALEQDADILEQTAAAEAGNALF